MTSPGSVKGISFPTTLSSDTGGSWATTGCSVTAMYPASTACFCNHSTNFAVLLQVRDLQVSVGGAG